MTLFERYQNNTVIGVYYLTSTFYISEEYLSIGIVQGIPLKGTFFWKTIFLYFKILPRNLCYKKVLLMKLKKKHPAICYIGFYGGQNITRIKKAINLNLHLAFLDQLFTITIKF